MEVITAFMFGLFDEIQKKSGKDVRFEKLCEDTYDDLKTKIYAKTWSKYLTDEIVQDTYELASKNKKKLMNHPEPEGWLYKTAINIYHKKEHKNKNTAVVEVELTNNLSAEINTVSNENGDIVGEILSELSEKERELLEYQFYDSVTLKEIATKWNVSYEGLRKFNYRLIIKFRKVYLLKTKIGDNTKSL